MPLLNRKPFSTEPPPPDLKENEEVFICRQTNEVYRDYESFFKRTILCNSLVWSCAVTLKHGLTFEEAFDSEKEAKKVAEHVPLPIQRGVLTLVHYTRHSRLDNLCDEVFNYIRDRYQEGEEVEVKYKGQKLLGYIHNVIEPSTLTNGFNSKLSSPKSKSNKLKNLNSPHSKNKSGKSGSLSSPSKPDSKNVIMLSDDEESNQGGNSTLPSPSSPKTGPSWPDAKCYQYEVKLKNSRNASPKTPEFITVKQSSISRRKGSFSRDKLKLLLRVTCYRSTSVSENGYWKVKDEYRQKFDLSPEVDFSLEDVPVKKKSKKRNSEPELNGESSSKKRKKSFSEEKQRKKMKKDHKLEKKDKRNKEEKLKKEKARNKMSAEDIEKLKLEMKLKREKEKEERKRERDVEKELKKKERHKARLEKQELVREQKMFLLHWCVAREDLDLNDHKELPTPVPVQCKFSMEMFGSMIMVLEFLHIFGEFFDMKQDIPDGVTLEMLEEALLEHDAEGIFYDILRFLLQCILKTHAEEEEEEGLDDSDVQDDDKNRNGKENEDETEESDFTRVKKAVSASASMAAAWAQLHQGKNLHELMLDPFTCSEILRLHFLSSGARLVSGPDGDTYRWQRRGGFTFADDAGVAFRHREHGIMRALVTSNIYDMEAVDKLKILSTLCTQLLTYATTRDIIEDGFDRWKKAKRELQEEQWADQRKDKEEAAAKWRKRQEEKAREREEKEKKALENKNQNPEAPKENNAKQNSSGQDSKIVSNEENKEEENASKALTRSQGSVPEDPLPEDDNREEIEREERKENLKKKERAFFKEIKKGQAMSGVQPVGTDRLFRRYWLFNSINGLFIEDNDSELYKLLQPIEEKDETSDEDSEDESVSGNQDELSVVCEESPQSMVPKDANGKAASTCTLTKEQILEEKELCRILKLYSIPLESLQANSPLKNGEISEKREELCEKLRSRDVIKWSYLDTKEDVDKLISSLNPRGFREKSLREALLQSYNSIVNKLADNPLRKENQEKNEDMKQGSARNKKGGLRNQPQGVDKTLYKTMEDFIEANLRDQILDLEDRIWQGGLGSVKTEDINAWRTQVENGIYDFPTTNGTDDNDSTSVALNGMDVDVHESEVNQQMEVDDGKEMKREESKSYKQTLLPLLEGSRPGTPVDSSFASTPTTSYTPQAINPCVRVLAKVVLEVEQGIERKYLIPPLGDDEETKKRKQQEAADAAKAEFDEMMAAAGKKKKEKAAKSNSAEDEKQDSGVEVQTKAELAIKQQKSLLERWEDSLMASTNLSQVFIHLTNLDNCISWDKSVLNARCRICRRKGDAEHMLLCDSCDRGHHMYCLKPPIKEIPDGDWFCPTCRPKEPRRSFRNSRGKTDESDEEFGGDTKSKTRREAIDESDDDEDEDDSSEEEEDSEDDEESDEEEEEDEEEEDEEAVEDSDEEGSVHMETCACCDGGGELLCCETCPLAYHLECAYPPLRRVPRGSWACQVCTGADSELPAGRRVKKSVIKAAQKRASESEVLPKAAKKAKISTTKTDTRLQPMKPAPGRRQRAHSDSDTSSPTSSSRSRKTPAVRVRTGGKPSTPKTSLTPRGLSSSAPKTSTALRRHSNSAPKKTTGWKWSAVQAKACAKLLKELKEHEDSELFLYPVDERVVPDYHLIIKTPMDLKTVESKLSSRHYPSVEEFVADVRQIFFNCSEYNKPRTREARAGIRLSAFFEERLGELGLDTTETRELRTRRSR